MIAPLSESEGAGGAGVVLAGLGLALPATSVSQVDLAEAATRCGCRDDRERRVLRGLYRRSGVVRRGCAILDSLEPGGEPLGIEDRFPASVESGDRGPSLSERMAMYGPAAEGLAWASAVRALERAGLSAAEVGHLVTVSCTGFAAPGVDVMLMDRLGLSASVTRTHVGFMGCHAAMNGLAVAEGLVTRSGRPALVVCVEVCTAHFRYGHDPRSLVANALFADGSASVVVRPAEDASEGGVRLVSRRSVVLPDGRAAMTWRLGDHGFEMTLSARVPELIGERLAGALGPWLSGWGLDASDLAGVAIHPGGPRVLGSALGAMGLEPAVGSASRGVLAEHGNMSSPTVLFILDRLWREAGVGSTGIDAGRSWLAMAFGPGLAVEAMLLRG